MKHIISALCLPLAAALALAACGGNATPAPSGTPVTSAPSTAPAAQAETPAPGLTVSFIDGISDVMKTETVESGKTATEYTPTKDGSVFLGWYATPSMRLPFDFTAPITEDTKIFAGFAVYQDDTRDFFIVGNGTSPLLLANAWGNNISDADKMTKGANNQYTITFDALAGDQFQFAINSSWESQRGFGYMTTGDLPDGTKAFESGGGLGGDSNTSNITCSLSGNYTFTLTTYPADEVDGVGKYDKITFVRNGDADATGEVELDYYIKGETLTSWGDVYDDTTKLVNDGTGKYTLTIAIPDDKPFMFTSAIADTTDVGPAYIKNENLDAASKALFDDDNGNLRAKTAGTYTFVYDSATKVLSAEQN